MSTHAPQHSTNSTTLLDLLERILDKGVVIAGDIKINLIQVELLSIQIRLLICSVDKAKEIGMDWWTEKLGTKQATSLEQFPTNFLENLEVRLAKLEASIEHSKTK
jgi:hypothetical protein